MEIKKIAKSLLYEVKKEDVSEQVSKEVDKYLKDIENALDYAIDMKKIEKYDSLIKAIDRIRSVSFDLAKLLQRL